MQYWYPLKETNSEHKKSKFQLLFYEDISETTFIL